MVDLLYFAQNDVDMYQKAITSSKGEKPVAQFFWHHTGHMHWTSHRWGPPGAVELVCLLIEELHENHDINQFCVAEIIAGYTVS